MKRGFWQNKRVFVTGANGFVGSWLTRALVEAEAQVIVLIKEDIPGSIMERKDVYSKLKAVVRGSLVDYGLVESIFKKHKIDTCFHLAAQAIVGEANQSPLPTFESNIKGTWNILEAARSYGISRMVIASSDKAYGEHEKLPYSEDFSLSALHPYDASKACCDILARTYAHTYDLPIAVTRCANIYGGGDPNFSRIIPDTIRSVLHKKNPIIRSDGSPLRDYIYIEDVVRAYLSLAERVNNEEIRGQAFNFGTEKPISVLNLVNKIIKISGEKVIKPIIIGKGKLKGEIDKQYLSIKKAQNLLGWQPEYNLEEGLKESIVWYQNFFRSREKQIF